MKLKEKHIERLAQGKKSGVNIGSRAVPHHLHQYEKPKFNRAIKAQFLHVTAKDRPNLVNLWDKYTQAKEWPCLVLKNLQNGQSQIYKNHVLLDTLESKTAKQEIINLTQEINA